MGIKGLPQYLSKNFPHLFVDLNMSDLRNSSIAIDTGIFMHRFTENMHYPLEYVDRFLNFARELTDAAVKYVFVFDGMTLVSKANTLRERRHKRDRNSQEIDRRVALAKDEEAALLSVLERSPPRSVAALLTQLHTVRTQKMRLFRKKNPVNRKFFYNLECVFAKAGIQYLVADQEAEMACAWLARKGYVDIVVSDDYDAIVCGSPLVLRRLKQCECPSVLNLRSLLGELGLNHSQFVDTCVLAGNDFAKPPMYYGFRRALQYVHATVGDADTTDENLLEKTFKKYYSAAYGSRERGHEALESFVSARNIFSCTAFPFSRSLLIFSFIWILHLLLKRSRGRPVG